MAARFFRSLEFKLLIAWLLVLVITLALDGNRTYLNQPNSSAELIIRQTVMLGFFALGSAVIIISGGIDLSSGSMIALGATTFGSLLLVFDADGCRAGNVGGGAIAGAFCGTVLVGVLVGTFHAWLITRVGLPPFVATLATLVGLRSLGRVLCNRVTEIYLGSSKAQIEFPDAAWRAVFKYLPNYSAAFVLLAIGIWLLMSRTVIGRQLHAMGGNERAAELSGIRTDLLKWLAYVIGAVTAALIGVVNFADTASAKPDLTARGYELNAIAAAVIGGCSLQGGIGSIPGVVLGCLFLRTVIDGVTKIVGAGADLYEGMIVGIVVVLAVTYSQRSGKSQGTRLFDGKLGIAAVPTLGLIAAVVSFLFMPAGWNIGWALAFGALVTAALAGRAVLDRRT